MYVHITVYHSLYLVVQTQLLEVFCDFREIKTEKNEHTIIYKKNIAITDCMVKAQDTLSPGCRQKKKTEQTINTKRI